MKKTSKKRNLIIGIIVVTLILIGVFAFGVQQSALPEGEIEPSGIYVDVPTIKYYECAPASESVASPWNSISSEGTGFLYCPDNTDQCDFEIRSPAPTGLSSFLTNYRIVYQVCDIGGSCQAQVIMPASRYKIEGQYATVKYNNMLKSQRIWIDYQKKVLFNWKGTDGAEYRGIYKPFVIWKNSAFEGRTEFTSVEQGCSYTPAIKDTLVKKATINLPTDTNTITSSLPPYKTDNFIDRFIPISTENYQFVEYRGEEGYCINGNIYGIDTITLGSGEYKIVNVKENPLLADKDCCPGDSTPNQYCEDFEWVEIQIEEDTGQSNLECSYFNPCPQVDWNPARDGTSRLIKQSCVEGTCVAEYQDVQCLESTDCDSGETCDTSIYQCVEVLSPIVSPQYEGLPVCDSCDAFVLNNLLGGGIKSLQCEKKLLQTNVTCSSSYLKFFLMPIIFLIGLIALPSAFNKLRGKKKPTKTDKAINFIVGLIISSILVALIYFLFWWGIIFALITFTIKPIIIAFLGGKKK